MKRGWYKSAESRYMGIGLDKFPDKYKGKFDVCTASGVFLPNHAPPTAMDDCHATLKPNGYFVPAMRAYLYEQGEKHGYRDQIDQMIADGKFKLVKTKRFQRGYEGGLEMFAIQNSILVCL